MEKDKGRLTIRIVNGRIVGEDRIHEGWYVEFSGSPGRMRVTAVGPEPGPAKPAGTPDEIIDAVGGYVLPGFVDIHVHGGGGSDFMDATPEDWLRIARVHARQGTTTMLATTMSAPQEALVDAARAAAEVRRRQQAAKESAAGAAAVEAVDPVDAASAAEAAWIAGIHLEGPFLNQKARGAQNGAFITDPSFSLVERIQQESGGQVRLVTLAPELPGALGLVQRLRLDEVYTACGHTLATYEEVTAAAGVGLSLATHTFNAMGQLHHRQPGVVGAALDLDGITAQAIVDGIHVHPAALRVLIRAKTPWRVALITDAMRAMGLAPGEYELGGLPVTVRPDGSARLSDGTLAGSVLGMGRAVKNAVRLVGRSLPEASVMASRTPAAAVGLGATKGRLAPGFDADVVIMDEGLEVRRTIAGGRTVYRAQP